MGLIAVASFMMAGTGYPGSATFTSSGDFVVPPGVTEITVEAWGSGGDGGTSQTSSGKGSGGGGGGAYAKKVINPASGTYKVTVGPLLDSDFGEGLVVAAKGANGTATAGGAGGSAASSVGGVKFSGGSGGKANVNPGSGGGGSATTSADGGAGQNAPSNSTAGSGGTGTGTGGAGGANGAVGLPGVGVGAGGGGAGKGNGVAGGLGQGGQVVITYLDSGPAPVPSAVGDVVTANSAPNAAGTDSGAYYDVLRRGGYLSENGHIVFPSFLFNVGPAIRGIWRNNGTGLKLLALTGNDAPETGATPAKFDVLPQTPAINDSGEVTFLASLAISGATTPPTTVGNDTGLWSELGGTGLGILMREDDDIPGLPAGTKVGAFASGCFATARTAASTGEAAFAIKMKGASTDSAILRTRITGAAVTAVGVVARENNPAPGTAENFGVVNGGYSDSMRMDATGNLAFVALTKPSNKEGLWYQPVGGSTAKAFIAGDTAPGTGGATFRSIKSPAIGSGGVITFRGFLNTNGDNTGGKKGDGIWRGTGSTVASYDCILRAGDDNTNRPGLGLPVGAKVGNVWHSWLTNSNRGAWRAWIDLNGNGLSSASDGDANAIFSDLSGTMTYLFKVGDAAPGMPPGATFTSIGLPVVGGAEQLAFLGNVTGGGTTASNSWGIWRSAANGGALALVLRTGDTMSTTQGLKTISKVDFPDTGFLDRRWEQPIMDSSGRLILFVTFTDGATSQVLVP